MSFSDRKEGGGVDEASGAAAEKEPTPNDIENAEVVEVNAATDEVVRVLGSANDDKRSGASKRSGSPAPNRHGGEDEDYWWGKNNLSWWDEERYDEEIHGVS